MGLSNLLAVKFGAPAIMAAIEEKDPALAALIDVLDEKTLPEAFSVYLEKSREINSHLPTKPIRIDEITKRINWSLYISRLLMETPAIKVICDILGEFGITEIAGINTNEFLQALASCEDS